MNVAPVIQPVAAYLVRPGYRAIRDAYRCHGIDEDTRRELRSIVLLEFEVHGASQPLELAQWHQEHTDTVPWDEVYFSLDRSVVLGGAFKHPTVPDFALAFYLHFFEPSSRLLTPVGTFTLPTPVWERPAHLASLRYQYWD